MEVHETIHEPEPAHLYVHPHYKHISGIIDEAIKSMYSYTKPTNVTSEYPYNNELTRFKYRGNNIESNRGNFELSDELRKRMQYMHLDNIYNHIKLTDLDIENLKKNIIQKAEEIAAKKKKTYSFFTKKNNLNTNENNDLKVLQERLKHAELYKRGLSEANNLIISKFNKWYSKGLFGDSLKDKDIGYIKNFIHNIGLKELEKDRFTRNINRNRNRNNNTSRVGGKRHRRRTIRHIHRKHSKRNIRCNRRTRRH